MPRYYESHITILQDQARERIKEAVEKVDWKFSAIDGDPVLGKRVYCYATKHRNLKVDEQEVIQELLLVSDILKELGTSPIRNKIEVVVFDDRQGDCATCPMGVI